MATQVMRETKAVAVGVVDGVAVGVVVAEVVGVLVSEVVGEVALHQLGPSRPPWPWWWAKDASIAATCDTNRSHPLPCPAMNRTPSNAHDGFGTWMSAGPWKPLSTDHSAPAVCAHCCPRRVTALMAESHDTKSGAWPHRARALLSALATCRHSVRVGAAKKLLAPVWSHASVAPNAVRVAVVVVDRVVTVVVVVVTVAVVVVAVVVDVVVMVIVVVVDVVVVEVVVVVVVVVHDTRRS